MNTTVSKQAVLSAVQQARVQEITDEAYTGFEARFYTTNGRYPSIKEAQAFRDKITPKLIQSVLKATPTKDAKALRKARIDAVTAAAALGHVKFLHSRVKELYEHPIANERISNNVTRTTYDVYERNATLGGETLAYKYHLTEDNRLQIVYSVAFCRHDENFDPLIGMEESLTKFNSGKVLYANLTHERLGEVKLYQLARDAKYVYEPIEPKAKEGPTDPASQIPS